MSNREVARVVREAERRHRDDLDRIRFILDAGVTPGEYRRLLTRRLVRLLVICLIVMGLVKSACDWTVATYGPRAEAGREGR
jgi:hypothetical protein